MKRKHKKTARTVSIQANRTMIRVHFFFFEIVLGILAKREKKRRGKKKKKKREKHDNLQVETIVGSYIHLNHMSRVTESTLSVRIRFILVEHVLLNKREKGKESWIKGHTNW